MPRNLELQNYTVPIVAAANHSEVTHKKVDSKPHLQYAHEGLVVTSELLSGIVAAMCLVWGEHQASTNREYISNNFLLIATATCVVIAFILETKRIETHDLLEDDEITTHNMRQLDLVINTLSSELTNDELQNTSDKE